jgi:uncharacterized protein (TIGR03067 family)
MFNRVVAGAIWGLVAVGPVGADNPKNLDEFRADQTLKLEGEWGTNRVYRDDGGIFEAQLNSGLPFIVLAVEGNHFTLIVGGKKRGGGFCSAYDKESGEVDLTTTTGVQKGIFHLDGEGTLILCLAEPGKDRPTGFESKEGSGHVFLKLKKQKP